MQKYPLYLWLLSKKVVSLDRKNANGITFGISCKDILNSTDMKINRLNPFKNLDFAHLAVLFGGSFLMMSCAMQIGEYTETDGVYYDPVKDVLPETVRYNTDIDEVYDYHGSVRTSIAEGAQHKSWQKNSGYWDDRPGISSDWGTYAGTETNVYNHGWGGYGWYSPYRWGWAPMSWYGSYYGGMGFGWGMSFGWNSYFSPYYSFYHSPYHWGYSPYGYGGMWGYSPWYYSGYYGMGYPRYYSNPIPYRRSGDVGSFNRNGYAENRFAPSSRFNTPSSGNTYRSGGFRNESYPQNGAYRSGGFREAYPSTRSNSWGNQGNMRSGGFNNSPSSGSFRSGGFSGGSSGGFSGGSSGGGSRSGGFR